MKPLNSVMLTALFFAACTGCDLFGGRTPEGDGEATVVWSYPVENIYEVKTGPAIEGDRVYAVADRRAYCFELDTGDLCWETPPLRGEGRTAARGDVVLLDERHLYTEWAGLVHALAKDDGSVVWRTVVDNFSTLGGRAAQTEDRLFLPGIGEVVRLAKADGRVDLRIPLTQLAPEGLEQTAKGPVISEEGLLYVPVGSYLEDAESTEGNLLVYDAETGAYEWGFEVPTRKVSWPKQNPSDPFEPDSIWAGGACYAVALSGDRVFVSTETSIYALDRRTGEMQWERILNDGVWTSKMLAIGSGKVFVGSSNGFAYALDLQTGEVTWSLDTPGFIDNVLAAHGRLYFCSSGSSSIWVVDAETGEVIWNGVPPEHERDDFYGYASPLAVSDDYMVNVGSHAIYALTVP